MMSDDDGCGYFVVMMGFWQNKWPPFVYVTPPLNGNTPLNTKFYNDDNKKDRHPPNTKFYSDIREGGGYSN